MSKVFKIPTHVIKYESGKPPENTDFDELIYEPTDGEIINVVRWERYPDYDYIFGVPAKTNPKYKLEVGFFQFRDTRSKLIQVGYYCDILECLGLINGFSIIAKTSQTHSPHLWEKFRENDNTSTIRTGKPVS